MRKPEASKREVIALIAASYPLAIGLSNAALLFDTLDYVHDTKHFADWDITSSRIGTVASELAGYPVAVACLDKIPSSVPSGYGRFGEVSKYQVVDPLLNTHYAPFNPAAIRLRSSECDAILADQASDEKMESRQDNFVSYAILIHEIEHLEHPGDRSESSIQCRANASMPERLERIGFSVGRAIVATGYAEAQSIVRLSPEYHEVEC